MAFKKGGALSILSIPGTSSSVRPADNSCPQTEKNLALETQRLNPRFSYFLLYLPPTFCIHPQTRWSHTRDGVNACETSLLLKSGTERAVLGWQVELFDFRLEFSHCSKLPAATWAVTGPASCFLAGF